MLGYTYITYLVFVAETVCVCWALQTESPQVGLSLYRVNERLDSPLPG